MAETKLSTTKIPNMKPKAEKLGLLTPKNRKMVSFKLDPKTVELLLDHVTHFKAGFYFSLSKTDVLETALLDFFSHDEPQKLALLQKYGVGRK